MAKYTKEQIIEKFRKMHGNDYDYSLVKYVGSHTKMKIICRKHGMFETNTHQYGTGCNICFIEGRRLSTTEFVNRSKKVHKNKYNYSSTIYETSDKKVGIICPQHGIFYQFPNDHMHGFGCSSCSNKRQITTDEFIQRSIDVHENKYNYSESDYISSHKKVKIICPHHGLFEQVAYDHMAGRGCFQCREIRGGYSSTFFINYPAEKSTPALLYIAKIKNNTETMIKIGITTKTFEERYNRKEFKNMSIELIESTALSLYDAFILEQTLLEKYKHTRFYTNLEKFGGHTECLKYTDELIKDIKSSINNLEA